MEIIIALVVVAIGIAVFLYFMSTEKCACGRRVFAKYIDCSPTGPNPIGVSCWKVQYNCSKEKGCGTVYNSYKA